MYVDQPIITNYVKRTRLSKYPIVGIGAPTSTSKFQSKTSRRQHWCLINKTTQSDKQVNNSRYRHNHGDIVRKVSRYDLLQIDSPLANPRISVLIFALEVRVINNCVWTLVLCVWLMLLRVYSTDSQQTMHVVSRASY